MKFVHVYYTLIKDIWCAERHLTIGVIIHISGICHSKGLENLSKVIKASMEVSQQGSSMLKRMECKMGDKVSQQGE